MKISPYQTEGQSIGTFDSLIKTRFHFIRRRAESWSNGLIHYLSSISRIRPAYNRMGIDILKIHTKEHPFPRDLIVEQSILDFLERNHTANLVELITFIKSRSRAIVDALDLLVEEGTLTRDDDTWTIHTPAMHQSCTEIAEYRGTSEAPLNALISPGLRHCATNEDGTTRDNFGGI